MKSIASRLSLIESKRRLTMMPLVVIYRASTGLSLDQEQRINDAKAINRPVKLIRTFVVNNE